MWPRIQWRRGGSSPLIWPRPCERYCGGLEAGGRVGGGRFAGGRTGRDAGERLAFGAAELAGDLAESVDEGGQAVGAGRFAQVVLGRGGDLGLGAVEVEVVKDGVDVDEHEDQVAGVSGVQADAGDLVVAAGLGDQGHGGTPPGVRLSGPGGVVACLGGAQPVGVGAGGDDVRVEGEPVDDGRTQPRVGEGGGPFGEGGVGRDRDGGAFLAFGEDLEQQFGAAPVQLEVAELVQAQKVDAAVAGDGAGQGLVVGGLDELVDQRGGGEVADPVAVLSGGGAQRDEQVGLAGAAVADQAARLPGGDPGAFGQGGDERGGDVRVGGVVEVLDPLGAGEAGPADQPGLAAGLPVVAFQGQQFGQEALVAGLLAGRGGGDLAVPVPDGRQPQDPAGLIDRGVGGGVGQLVAGGPGHHAPPSPVRGASSWS